MTPSPRRLRASWVVPVSAPPIADGAVLIAADGRIVAVGPDHAVPRPQDARESHLANAALIPGLVNTHTHLELTGFEGSGEHPDFTQWITGLRQRKAERSAGAYLDAARQGVRDCWAAGVTTVADTGDTGAAIRALDELGGRGVCYQEVFGPHPDQRDDGIAFLRRRVGELLPHASGRVRLGVSPHAPYSVSGPLYRAVAEFARAEALPVAVHLAESPAESALVTSGDGPFARMWRGRGIPMPADQLLVQGPADRPMRSPVAWLDHHGVLGPDTLAIHAIQLDADDIALLATRGVAVAHCPLSNRRHGHGDAPLRALLDAGLRVGVGTDSVASVGRLDLLAEARAARILAALDAAEALALATSEAARAIGMAGEVGVLAAGAWGDVAAVALREVSPSDLHESVLASGPGDVLATWVAGREVFRRGGPSH